MNCYKTLVLGLYLAYLVGLSGYINCSQWNLIHIRWAKDYIWDLLGPDAAWVYFNKERKSILTTAVTQKWLWIQLFCSIWTLSIYQLLQIFLLHLAFPIWNKQNVFLSVSKYLNLHMALKSILLCICKLWLHFFFK